MYIVQHSILYVNSILKNNTKKRSKAFMSKILEMISVLVRDILLREWEGE